VSDFASINGLTIHYKFESNVGVPVVFVNSLGSDLRIWDKVVATLKMLEPALRQTWSRPERRAKRTVLDCGSYE
jgi:hypothetical protein